jgi:hypothetical protein
MKVLWGSQAYGIDHLARKFELMLGLVGDESIVN